MVISPTSVLAIGVFSLLVLVVAFAWVCLLELWPPMNPSRFSPCRARRERREGERRSRTSMSLGWLDRYDRRRTERRRGQRRVGFAHRPLNS